MKSPSSVKNQEYLNLCENADYSLKKFLPFGLCCEEYVKIYRADFLNRHLRRMLAEIHSSSDMPKYLRLHNAFRIIYLLAGVCISIFFILVNPVIDASLSIFCLALLAGMFFLPDFELYRKVKKRRLMLQAEFPDFLNKMVLLLGAGMTIPRAWEKIIQDSERQTFLYKELYKSMLEIHAGISILEAYEGFARRCRLPEINKFVTLILQNIKKGNAELVLILRVQSTECWEMRKLAVKKIGEEASTKMLFPLLLMLVAILLIVSTPALIAISAL